MLIFWRLLLGHLLADFTFQSNAINAWKRRSVWGMLLHCGMHPVLYAALTWPYLSAIWVRNRHFSLTGWACLAVITALHFVEDQWRVYHIRQRLAEDNTLYFLWDQAIHWLCLFVFLPIGMFDQAQGWLPERWPVILCLMIAATHFCGILISFIERDLFGSTLQFDHKYAALAERLMLVCCVLFPGGWWWLGLSAFWIAGMIDLRRRRVLDFSWFSFYFGGGFAAASGLLARLILYAGN